MNAGALPQPYVRMKDRNRSLSPAGRRLFLCSISLVIVLLAGYATYRGAWLVMPFAGLEVLLVLLAFRLVRVHEDDYERFEISAERGCFQARSANEVSNLEFNPEWAQVVYRQKGWRCDLALRFKGRQVEIGRLMSDEERMDWAQELKPRIRVVRG
jgi:uncharacterized membrane protein